MNTEIKKQLFFFLVLSLFLMGCNQIKKDWERTKQSNSLVEVKMFLATNPESKFDQEAKILLDSLEWISILKTKNVDSLELFLKNHTKSQFLLNSMFALDSIDWNIAYYSRDSIKLREYIMKYSNPKNTNIALNLIEQIAWTPSLVDESKNSFRVKFPKETFLTFNVLKQKYHWNNEAFIFSIGKIPAAMKTQNGSSYAIAARDEGSSISCNFPLGIQIVGDFAFGNLKFYNTHASGREGGILFTEGTEMIFSNPLANK